MDPTAVGYLACALLLLSLLAGVPVAVSMAVAGILGMWFGAGPAFMAGQLSSLPFAVSANYAYAVLPLFVLMGILAEYAGITEEVFRAANAWLRRVRGGFTKLLWWGRPFLLRSQAPPLSTQWCSLGWHFLKC